ncbi:hypothetical protein WR25_22897 [Diploscapter pachys]|uniref:G-protein coupled receptors family 1 profile domain-containing protein n=1 Tax=Diploscapter pachys TaxID=2018661 RepID=A0A2A2KTJ6_9BILA|nr:hypothetical protein WR25_22897 [Diploscapter pachys]
MPNFKNILLFLHPIFRMYFQYQKNKEKLSRSAVRAQKNIIYVIACYFAIYLMFIVCPVLMTFLLLIFGMKFLSTYPLMVYAIISFILPCSACCTVTLICMTPYRKAVLNIIDRIVPIILIPKFSNTNKTPTTKNSRNSKNFSKVTTI